MFLFQGYDDIVEYFVKIAKANINSQNSNGITALHYAAHRGENILY